MRPCSLFIALFLLSLLLSIPSLLRIPRVLPFIHADVRAAAPQALDELRAQGIWLVNVDLLEVKKEDGGICFLWAHRYTSRTSPDPPELLTTCTHALPR